MTQKHLTSGLLHMTPVSLHISLMHIRDLPFTLLLLLLRHCRFCVSKTERKKIDLQIEDQSALNTNRVRKLTRNTTVEMGKVIEKKLSDFLIALSFLLN